MNVIRLLSDFIEGISGQLPGRDSGSDVGPQLPLPEGCDDCRTAGTLELVGLLTQIVHQLPRQRGWLTGKNSI